MEPQWLSWGGGELVQRGTGILKQLFCDWRTPLPSPELSNEVWSLFLSGLQNLLMRPNPFNSSLNCRNYGYNCGVCICQCVCLCVCVRECVQLRAFVYLLSGWKGKSTSFLWRRNHIKDINRAKTWSINIRPNEFHLTRPTRVCKPEIYHLQDYDRWTASRK